jgi:hypothetical protein
MRVSSQLSVSLLLPALLIAFAASAHAQSISASPHDTGVVPDDELTLVVGTRFVTAADDQSAAALFTKARIPLSRFNDTDHCVDQNALKVAQDYFTDLGRVLGKAGHYYFVPDDAVKKSVEACATQHGRAPQAWVEDKTQIVAFGRVVPTNEAAALEEQVR